MERRPRSPNGRNAPGKSGPNSGSGRGPKTGLESGFRKRDSSKGSNFSTRDGKEGFRSDDKPKRSYGDKPDRGPKRDFSDKPKRDYGDKPKRDFGDRPARGNFEDKPKRSYGDRPQRNFDDKPKRSYGDKPERGGYSDKPKRDYGDRPARSFDDKPKRSYGDGPKRDFGDKPKRSYGDKPERGGYSDKPKRDYGDRPARSFDDKPKRSYGDGPKRDFGDKPKRSYGDRPQRSFDDKPKRSYGDGPKRDFGDRPKRDFGDKPARGGFSRDRSASPRPERERYTGPRIEVSVYGIHAVCAALKNPDRKIRAIYSAERDLPDIQSAYDQALEDGMALPEITVVDINAFHQALPRDAVHQGVGLDAEPLEEVLLHDIIRKAEVKKKSVVLILDHVTDPHNIGAIIRSACAFGADAVILQNRNAPEMSGLISKTASGAGEHVPLVYETNLSRAIEELKENGFFALALDERGTDIADAPTYDKTVLVLGAEGPGIRPLVKDKCDLLVKLPTSGPISSLNVSNAAAISLFAIASKAK